MQIEPLKQGLSIPFMDAFQIALITKDDLADIVAMLNTAEVATYLFYAPAPAEAFAGYFQPIIDETKKAIGNNEWPQKPNIIVRDEAGRFMGMAGLEAVMLHPGNFEVGFQLPVHAWRRGIATAGCRFLTKLAFEEMGAHKITADCFAGNVGSYKTLEKCGYVREGTQKDYYKLDKGFDDRALYGMTREQFARLG